MPKTTIEDFEQSGRQLPPNVTTPGHKNRKWHVAAMCIACGMTTKKTAEHCGISVGTLQHWRRHPKFKAYVEKLHDESIERAIGRLTNAMTKAANVVVELLGSKNQMVQLAATKELKDWVKSFRNDSLILKKLAVLEQHMHQVPAGDE